MEFESFKKIARLSRDVICTEKIDGTNAQIAIDDDGSFYVGSRSRWLGPGEDNYGFYAWAMAHRDELMQLGPGRHYGEWWGSGINRGYGLTRGEKRFSLFNTARWGDDRDTVKYATPRPTCCGVVPVLYQGPFDTQRIDLELLDLRVKGSAAAPGFMNPEGIVIFHPNSGTLFKKTLQNDGMPKSLVANVD